MGDTTTQDLVDFAPPPPSDARIVEAPRIESEAFLVQGPRADRPVPARPQRQPDPRITDPAVQAAIAALPENVRAAAEAHYLSLSRTGGDGTATATAQRDLALAQGERVAREEYARSHRDELERYRSKRVELPDFIPTQENAMSLGTLFGLIGVVGTMMGGKGQQSAMGALNAMSGMMAGWRQGRTDLYNRERQKFEQEMKRVQEQNAILQRDFQDAMNLSKSNLDARIAAAREVAARHGVSMAAAAATRQGMQGIQSFMANLVQVTAQMERTQSNLRGNYQRVVDPSNPNRTVYYDPRTNQYLKDNEGNLIEAAPTRPATQAAGRPIVIPETQADGSVAYYYGRPDGQFLTQDGRRVQAPAPGGASVRPIVVERVGEDGKKEYYYARPDGTLIMQDGEPVRAPAPRGDQTERDRLRRLADVGPGGQEILRNQTPENRAAAEDFIGRTTFTAKQRDQISSINSALAVSEMTAKFILDHPRAVGVLAAASVRAQADPISGLFSRLFGSQSTGRNVMESYERMSPEQQAAARAEVEATLLREGFTSIDGQQKPAGVDQDDFSRAVELQKMLFSLALADAVGTGRPTVYLERTLRSFYAQSLREETLLALIRERSTEAVKRLPTPLLAPDTRMDFDTKYPLLAAPSATDYLNRGRGRSRGAPSAPSSNGINLNEFLNR